jgi:hypothetical protein
MKYHELIFVARKPGGSLPSRRVMRRRLVLLASALLIFGLGAPSYADPRADRWQTARTAYEQGNFAQALQILQPFPENTASYYYNLGTLHYRLGHWGPAVAYLTKARSLGTGDPDIRFNLGLAEAQLARSIGTERLDSSSNGIETLSELLDTEPAQAGISLLGAVLSLVWLAAYRKHRSLSSGLLHPAAWIGVGGMALATTFSAAQSFSLSVPPGICLEDQVVRSGPGDHFIELARLPAGVKVRVMSGYAAGADAQTKSIEGTPARGSSVAWRQVRYASGAVGWVRASSVLLL